MAYISKPKPCFLDRCKKYKVVGDTQIYSYKDKFYTWDGLHGEIEVFNHIGVHISVIHPVTGIPIKAAVKGRKIDV